MSSRSVCLRQSSISNSIFRATPPATLRFSGTDLDLAYRDLDRKQSGPNDDPADENVALDEDEYLPWPDHARRRGGPPIGLASAPRRSCSDAFRRQRHAAALELAIWQPNKAMFEVHARGRLQRQLIPRARGRA